MRSNTATTWNNSSPSWLKVEVPRHRELALHLSKDRSWTWFTVHRSATWMRTDTADKAERTDEHKQYCTILPSKINGHVATLHGKKKHGEDLPKKRKRKKKNPYGTDHRITHTSKQNLWNKIHVQECKMKKETAFF